MGESRRHMELVNMIESWVTDSRFLGANPVVWVDNPSATSQTLPPIIADHRPDLFATSNISQRKVIAEAKTPNDLETSRSKKQIEAFLLYAARSDDNAFVLATAWDHARLANSIVREISARCHLSKLHYAIMDQFGKVVAGSNGWV